MVHLSLDSTIKLPSGNLIPRLGFGVYQARSKECEQAVLKAAEAGYRHVDSAQGYHNEEYVGRAIRDAPVPRSSVYLATKYMPSHKVFSPEEVLQVLRKSIKKIDRSGEGEPYIDLMLIHAPWGGDEGRRNNWEALGLAQKEGWVKDIGVSNFGVAHLKSLPGPLPAVNQIELHPFCQQRDIVEYCQEKGIAIEAYSPLMRGEERYWDHPVLVKISKKHKKDVAQIAIRWSLQKGFIPLPKSATPARIQSNAHVFDFELSSEEMVEIDGLDKGTEGAITWNPVNHE
ncbi:aldo-keto reductase [Cryptococcus wingfieldii CBS 7118]|uniref:Aldo-keto reductase n=1 Tax=Cryptococcus wingfieldii CBS 7118 TaxID=1295528 RepID=A0A1E3JB99_9TREE|nr:aldo-keto reductase [Cryptococcus wingfieldii CBS 7118]ODN97386.1 aldo-keto reductase [Cryptococcus wingfieldii CBS 7118]